MSDEKAQFNCDYDFPVPNRDCLPRKCKYYRELRFKDVDLGHNKYIIKHHCIKSKNDKWYFDNAAELKRMGNK